MKDWIQGDPQRVEKKDLTLPWSGYRDGRRFRCGLCGHRFKEGDYIRFLFTNKEGLPGGNPFTCEACDGPDVLERWKQHWENYKALLSELKNKYWKFHNDKGYDP